jgi:2-polyprenyl-3-methyl-5-hydroxy-6-metoxy-1,4-benzoquinol methylase
MNIISLFIKTFPNFALATYATKLEAELLDCNSILDVGCGDNSPIRLITRKKYSVGIDGDKKAIQKSKENNIHDEYVKMDIRLIKKIFKKKNFDAVVALDVIEHLEKNEGVELLKDMESLAMKKVVLLTPNGFISQIDHKNRLQKHLSGWNVQDLLSKGYKPSGMYGWKSFRGEHADLKTPKIFFGIISEFTHYLYTNTHPEYSFSLFAVKNL